MADRVGSIVVNGLVVAVLFILINRGFDNRAAIFFGVLAGLAVGLLVVWQHNRFDLYKFARRFASVMVAYEDEAGYASRARSSTRLRPALSSSRSTRRRLHPALGQRSAMTPGRGRTQAAVLVPPSGETDGQPE
jgi:hypothetical protein